MDPDRELWVACQAVVAEHNAARAGTPQCMMLASVHSEDDMVYERKVYM